MTGTRMKSTFSGASSIPRATPSHRPNRAAQMLALAHHVENLVDSRKLADYAAAARALGVTRARLTQIMNILLLSPKVQERVLVGAYETTERQLRPLADESEWSTQMRLADRESRSSSPD